MLSSTTDSGGALRGRPLRWPGGGLSVNGELKRVRKRLRVNGACLVSTAEVLRQMEERVSREIRARGLALLRV